MVFLGRLSMDYIRLISVAKKFRDMVDFQIVLNPILERQLGLIDEPHRLGAIPFSERKLQSMERKFSKAITIPRSPFDLIRGLMSEALKPKPASGREVTWHKLTTTVDPYNFYGIKSIDLGRNAITSLWIFCDAVDTSWGGSLISLVRHLSRRWYTLMLNPGMIASLAW